jgi:hypothetical protein
MPLVTFSLEAAKDLRRYGDQAASIRCALVTDNVNPVGWMAIEPTLKSPGLKRLRVGEFLVICEDTDTMRVVTKIGPWGGVDT